MRAAPSLGWNELTSGPYNSACATGFWTGGIPGIHTHFAGEGNLLSRNFEVLSPWQGLGVFVQNSDKLAVEVDSVPPFAGDLPDDSGGIPGREEGQIRGKGHKGQTGNGPLSWVLGVDEIMDDRDERLGLFQPLRDIRRLKGGRGNVITLLSVSEELLIELAPGKGIRCLFEPKFDENPIGLFSIHTSQPSLWTSA